MNPSLSSFYSVVFPLPGFIQAQNPALYDGELLELSCQEASLPGSSIATLEQTNDYAGVTERHGYRRMYDETIDFTFLVTVNSGYKQIRFFDYWMKFICGEIDKNGRVQNLDKENIVMRARYPDGDGKAKTGNNSGYRTKLNIVKYERDMGWTHPKRESKSSNLLEYHFVDAYPKISTPTYELTLPSTDKTIQYRPFLVREEKLLVLALESEDTKQITTAIKTVIKSCILTKGVKVEALPTFDIEYLFLNIRGKSVGEELDVNIICPDDEKTYVPTKIYIDDIHVIKDEKHTKEIKLDDTISMVMKYPSLDEFINQNFDFDDKSSNLNQSFELIGSCIDTIVQGEEAWSTADCSKKEVMEFLDQMNSAQFKLLEGFFETMPKLSHEVEVTNPKTGVKRNSNSNSKTVANGFTRR